MRKTTLLFCLFFSLWAPGFAQIPNGGFETGDFTNWTYDGPPGDPVFVDNFSANSGGFGAALGNSVIQTLTYSTPFATVAGQAFTISFALANGDTGNANFFQVDFDGQSSLIASNDSAFTYAPFTFSGTGTGAQTSLVFSFYNVNDFFSLDDVDVAGATLVAAGAPELDPGKASLPVALCFFSLTLLYDRKRSNVSVG